MLRIAGVIVLLAVISFLVYCLLYFAPGDIVKNLIGAKKTDPTVIAALRVQYGLDGNLWTQYTNWLGRVLRGDFGTSVQSQLPVLRVFRERGGVTGILCLLAFAITLVISVPLGVIAARTQGRWPDSVISTIALVGLSAPAFVIGLILLYALAYYLPLFPVFGVGTGFGQQLYHLFLPALALAIGSAAIIIKLTRTAMIQQLAGDHVMFARARGLSESRVTRIALKNAAVAITTSAGLVLTYLVGGTVLVESTFSIPGLGSELENAVQFKDFPVVQFLVLVVALIIAVIMLAVDLLYLVLDPRLRRRAA